MKKTLLIACTMLATVSFAQTPQFTKNQVIEVKMNTEMDMNMNVGMPMTIKSDNKIVKELKVLDVKPNAVNIESSFKKFKTSTSMMGNEMVWDSESNDNDPEMDERMKGEIAKKEYFLFDPTTLKATSVTKDGGVLDKDVTEDGQLPGMGDIGQSSDIFATIYVKLPANAKVGTTWTDSTSSEGIKTINKNKLVSNASGVAHVEYTTTIVIDKVTTQGGVETHVKMTMDGSGWYDLDTKTSTVKKRKVEMKIDGVVDAGGMTMPVDGTQKVEVEVN